MTDRQLSLILFLAAAIWGLYWVPLRALEGYGLHEAWAVAFFSLPPALVLAVIVIWRGETQHLARAAMIGGFIGLGMGLYAFGLVATSVVRTTILFYLTPIWSTLIGVFWLSETLTKGRIAAIILGLVGLLLMVSGPSGAGMPLNFGDFCAFLSGIFWALGAASMKRFPEVPTASVTGFQFGMSALIGLILALVFAPDAAPPLESLVKAIPITTIASVLILVPNVFLIIWISKRLFPGRVGVLMMSEVMIAIISATLFLPEETMTVLQWTGGAAIIAACFCEVL